jgi:hypothetical protein
MPGNKDLKEIAEGIKILGKEEMAPIRGLIKDDVAIAVATEYQHQEKEGKAKIILGLKQGAENYSSVELEDEIPLSNLQLKPLDVATLGRDFGAWNDYADEAENQTTMIWLIVQAAPGHYVAVEHDTMNCTVTARESAEDITTGLTSEEYAPIQFSCHGAPMNNCALLDGVLSRNVGNECKNLSDFFKGLGTVKKQLNPAGKTDYGTSPGSIVSAYKGERLGGFPALESLLKFSVKFDNLLQKCEIKQNPEKTRKLNLIVGLARYGSEDPHIKALFEQMESILAKDPKSVQAEEFARAKELFDKIELKL